MMTITPADLDRRQVYKLMTGSIVPRPIAWVSTQSLDGIPNLAPFSYFSAVSAHPPLVLFCAGTRSADMGEKDTYHNVKVTGEFVINIVSVDNAEMMNTTAQEVAADVDEFERSGATPLPSEVVHPPRVAQSPIHFECKLYQMVDAGDGHIIIGEIVKMHFRDDVFQEGNYINTSTLQPLARLAGPNYASLSEPFQIQRLPSEIKGS